MPANPNDAEIVPELLTPPAKVVIVMAPPVTPVPPTRTPLRAESVPAFLIPPRKVGPLIEMALPEVEIALLTSSAMPPVMIPDEPMKPVMLPLVKVIPPGAIVPSLVILPVKLVLVTATQGVECAAGLSKAALMLLTHAASAGGAPPPISSAAAELDSRRTALRPPEPINIRLPRWRRPSKAALDSKRPRYANMARIWGA
jgi:hypothetical protein